MRWALGAGLAAVGAALGGVLLAGCTGPADDPALTRYATSVGAYSAGREKLTAGDATGAVAAFREALAADPEAAALSLWLARAQAESADLPGAIATLDDLLARHPGASIAWYNRGAYKARAGDLRGAALDLTTALSAGVSTPAAATLDPDYAALRGHPDFPGLLPPGPVTVSVEGPEGAVFLGGQVEVRVTLVGVAEPYPELAVAGAAPPCLRLHTVVEDSRAEGAELWRTVTMRFDTVGPCRGQLGPVRATVAGLTVEDPGVPIVVDAPPGASLRAAAAPLPSPLPLPGGLVVAGEPIHAARVGPGVASVGRPDRPVTVEGRKPDVRLELRAEGQTRGTGGWWAAPEPVTLTAEGWSTRI